MGYFDELEKNIVYYLKTSEFRNKSKNKKKLSPDKVGHPPISFFVFLELGAGDPCRMIVW